MSSKQPPQPFSNGRDTTLQLLLQCTDKPSKRIKVIRLPTIPCATSTQELKSIIETECNIPACTQKLDYEAQPLVGETDLGVARVRSGDSITVSYLSEGDCEEILKIISWMGVVLATMKQENPSVSRGMSQMMNDLITQGIEFEYIENLAFDYFYPWLDARKYVNKLHFVHNGGLEIMMEIYSLLLGETWSERPLKMKYLEYGILRVLWNLSETFALRRLIFQLGGLDMCMQSLLREVVVKGEVIVDHQSHRGTNQDWILVENIGAALGTLCNLSELPEVHLPIATQPGVVEQLTCITLSPSVRLMSSLLVATVFLCLAATPQTHQYISKQFIIERLIEVFDSRRDKDEDGDVTLLKYFSLMFFAQVALVSPDCIPETHCRDVSSHLTQFLNTATYEEIRKGEIKNWYVWQTFLPYIKLAFIPDNQKLLSENKRTLQRQSLELIVFGLQNMLGRQNHRSVLLQENLLDYVTCMPWFLSQPVRHRAQALVDMLVVCPDVSLRPPRLLSLAGAALAKAHFGLQNIVELSVGEIATNALALV